jgi:hypothetical protein
MSKPRTGSRHVFTSSSGLGYSFADGELDDEMNKLDLKPNTQVKVCGYDDDRNLVLVEWTDQLGTPRITSIEPEVFDKHFTKG